MRTERAGAVLMSRGTVWLMAAAAGVGVANLYYSQPLLAAMAADLHVSERDIGVVSALTQAGYALGLLLVVPLGDKLERRRLIAVMLVVTAGALVAVAVAPNAVLLGAASLAMGAATI